jgi:hypothetical protein
VNVQVLVALVVGMLIAEQPQGESNRIVRVRYRLGALSARHQLIP